MENDARKKPQEPESIYPSHSVYHYFDWTIRDIGKLGADFVFGQKAFQDAASTFSDEQVAELYYRIRVEAEAQGIPETHWREEFLKVFAESKDAIPPLDWTEHQLDHGPGVFRIIADYPTEDLEAIEASFQKYGFSVVNLCLSMTYLAECYHPDDWHVIAEAEKRKGEALTAKEFAQWQGREDMVALIEKWESEQ